MACKTPERAFFLPVLFAIAVASSAPAHAETVHLACKERNFSGVTLSVAIDLGARRVVVLGDYGLRWEANVQAFDNRIYWETGSGRNMGQWTLDRYTLTLTTYARNSTSNAAMLAYSCKISSKPRRKIAL
jgi:hypothetical protein